MLTLVDTNVLLRAAEPTHSQHEVAVSALRALPKRGYKPCIVPQVLYEFWVVVTRPIEENGAPLSSRQSARAQFWRILVDHVSG